MQVAKDQNSIEDNGRKANFVEGRNDGVVGNDCQRCCFRSRPIPCITIPCWFPHRRDGKNGYFEYEDKNTNQ